VYKVIKSRLRGSASVNHRTLAVAVFGVLYLAAVSEAGAQAVNVFTRSIDNQRSGANLAETILAPSNVKSSQFGKLFALPVDDQIYAGMLYASGLTIAGGSHNTIFAATVNNTVYAFDADTYGLPLWQRNFNGSGRPTRNTEVGQACTSEGGFNDFRGNIGIVGTPVIDGTSNTMYFVTRTVESAGTVQRLRAIDITTGNDRAGSPVVIQASVPGSGDGGSSIVFNSVTQNQRPALALSQGQVYIAWASYCDTTPYHGWVMTYDARTLARTAAFNATPNGSKSGIWMAGAGPVFDTPGNVYFSTGNGDYDGATNFGESVVKLAPSTLLRLDYFTASNFNSLNASDLDFGSGGPVLVPGSNVLVTGGKEGKLYVLNTSNLGQMVAGDIQIPQVFQAVDPTVRPSATHHIHASGPVWNSPAGINLYVWGENDFPHSYRFNAATQVFNPTPVASGTVLPPVGMPGGIMALSANGAQAGTGILWAVTPRNGDANMYTAPGNFYALNAETMALLWSSTGVGDDMYSVAKGSPPVVAKGKAYVASLSKFISVYGPRSAPPPSQNLALNKAVTGSTACNTSEGPGQAVNGTYSLGLTDKWCSNVTGAFLQVDLGAPVAIGRFLVEHAGAGVEDFSLNTSAFNIQVSTDGVSFTTVVTVTGNVDSITTHDITPVTARFVRLNIVTPTGTTDKSTRIYEFQVFGAAVAPNFSLSATPSSQTVTAGGGASFSVTAAAQNGFVGTISLNASGLPAGATAAFSPTSLNSSGTSTLTISTASSASAGSYPVTISATSGAIVHTSLVTLTIAKASSGSSVGVNLASVYNRLGFVNDGTTFSGGGLDSYGYAYSAKLLGSTIAFGGSTFALGTPNALNAVTSATITLPAGQYSTLTFLGTGLNGSQKTQSFTVKYTDGSSSLFTQNLSDWFAPKNYPGESIALTMSYRDSSWGAADNRTFYLYGYSFALNPGKTVQSLVLPANGNVAVLAVTLMPALQVPLSSAFTKIGIVTDGSTFSTGLDGYGYAYSASLLGSSLSAGGAKFSLGAPNLPNAATSGTVLLPNAVFSAVKVLATGVSGSQKAQAFTVRYADGSTSVFKQDLSDWFTPKTYAGESIALTMAYRNSASGAKDNRTFHVYYYSFTLTPGKVVSSITLPGNANVPVLAITMVP
jgi:hypothetical protein